MLNYHYNCPQSLSAVYLHCFKRHFAELSNVLTNLELCMPFIMKQIDRSGRLTAWLNSGIHFSCAFHLQTQKTSMAMDDSDDNVIQNTDSQSNVSITNTSVNVHV